MGRAAGVALLLWSVAGASVTDVAAQVAMSGAALGEFRVFPSGPGLSEQESAAAQVAIAGEMMMEASVLKHLKLTFNPYYRYDLLDSGRSLLDLHQLKVAAGGKNWHVKAGYDVEFWGVMEAVNPVNIINQTDVTEDFLAKRKLGQPMVDLTVLGRWGTVDLYGVAGFRPMQFPTAAGRLRTAIPIHEDEAVCDAGHGCSHLDGAVRYFTNVRNVYLGVSHFYGYAREPEMLVRLDSRGIPFLVPSYNLEHQTGFEVQVTFGNLILKSEDVVRQEVRSNHSSGAVSIGAEYDARALMNGGRTISVFGEYYHDSRDRSLIVPFTDDLFVGVRLGLNERRSTEIRVWGNYDLVARKADAVMLDASTRISERMKVVVGLRGIVAARDAFASISRDSHVVVKLEARF